MKSPLFFMFLFCLNCWSQIDSPFVCTITSVEKLASNLAADGEVLVQKVFKYDRRQKETGREFKYRDLILRIWFADGQYVLRLNNSDLTQVKKAKFLVQDKRWEVRLNPKQKVSCISEKTYLALNSTKEKKSSIIGPESDLFLLRENVSVAINEDLVFKYNQHSFGKMKILIFQAGKLLTNDDPKSLGPWCMFKIETKLDEDMTVPKGDVYATENVKVFDSGENDQILSYSFFDFSTGKKVVEKKHFTPFSLECSVKKHTPFTYQQFQQITGSRVGLKIISA